jgi:septal ring factor EnvC (AmiA/AmiB activator)
MNEDDKALVVPTGGRNLDPMIGFGGLNRIDPRFALIAGLVLALPMALSLPVSAQDHPTPPAQGKPADTADTLKQRQQELQTLRGEQSKSAEAEAALKREIEEIGDSRRKLNQALIDAAARLRSTEAEVTASEDRLKPLDAKEDKLRKSLTARQAVIGQVLAALQRIGRRPPPALIASPEDALKAVRSAMVLGAVLPEMRHDVEALAKDLLKLVTLRQQITVERDRLKAQVASLTGERTRMSALIAARQKQQAERESALAAERQRAGELAQKADNLKDLIAKLEQALAPAERAARQAPKPDSRAALAALHDPGRLAPAVAFVSLHGKIPLPVNGIKIKIYGAPDGVGGVEKGISIATRAGAEVTSPADGWVVYAGPFRSYGQLLILNAGGGYHILLAGMERISVDLGQFVLTGEPVAVMGTGSHVAAILATGSSQPVLYVEFRKDGTPVDPGPWWASGEGEKVRG